MTITAYDTSTGTALTVHEVAAALDLTDMPTSWADAIDAWHIATRGRTFTAALSEMRAAMQLAGDRLDELGIRATDGGGPGHDPEQPASGESGLPLKPDPALALAPEALDAEHAQAMAIQAERRRRMAALAPIGQRFVPEIPQLRKAPTDKDWLKVEPVGWQRIKSWASGWGEWLKPSGGER